MKNKFIFLVLITILSQFGFSQTNKPTFETKDISIADVNAIMAKNPKSVEEFLDYLPFEYRSQYTLMEQSRSLQEARLEAPRAIIFGRSAQTVISFNGSPEQRGYNSIEMVLFDKNAKTVQWRQVLFVGNKATMSEANPTKCLGCHQNGRPIWRDYNTDWTGAFDENNPGPTSSHTTTQRQRDFLNSTKFTGHSRYSKLGYPYFLCKSWGAGCYTLPYVDPNRFLGSMLTYRWSAVLAGYLHNSRVQRALPDDVRMAAMACGSDSDENLARLLKVAAKYFPDSYAEFEKSLEGVGDSEKVSRISAYLLQDKEIFLPSLSPLSLDVFFDKNGDGYTGFTNTQTMTISFLGPKLSTYQRIVPPLLTDFTAISGNRDPYEQAMHNDAAKFLKWVHVDKLCETAMTNLGY